MLKRTVLLLYVAVILAMAAATFAEHLWGADYYHEWWFSALWALLAAVGTVYFLQQRVRRASVVVLHLSLLVILAGALLTHLTSRQGVVHLREGVPTSTYADLDSRVHDLPFTLRLDSFAVVYHAGTRAAADYQSHVTLTDDHTTAVVSMNKILSAKGVRLYQSSYDTDGHGSTLTLNSDPWGIPVTYTGYALLFIGLLWMLVDPKGTYRQLLRSPLLKRGAAAALLLLAGIGAKAAPPVVPDELVGRFSQLNMLYGDRICPVQTFALDFTKKLYGKRSYGDYSAEEVLMGFIVYPDEWSREPIIRMKSAELRQLLHVGEHCSVADFFDDGGYRLGPLLQEYYQGKNDKLHQEVAKTDDKLMLVMNLRRWQPLSLFPYQDKWYSPTDSYPQQMEPERQAYMKDIIGLLVADVRSKHTDRAAETIAKIGAYQQRYGGASIPSAMRQKAELLYNKIPFATILFMVNLTMGLVCLLLYIVRRTRVSLFTYRLSLITMGCSLAALTLCLALRWIVSGTVPLTNGYETMLFMPWVIMVLAVACSRRFPVMLMLGFLMSGFFLLVSHISQMDPQIGHIMPVLNSPLLTIHVSIIMMAFALLSMTFIIGLAALPMKKERESLALLSRLLLYPAITCLGFGIFIGAIWANVSWGTYWSWDPKETWALITLMVYVVALHQRSLPWLSRPLGYHLFMVAAFATILMTYFGVNYILGGMHSYA